MRDGRWGLVDGCDGQGIGVRVQNLSVTTPCCGHSTTLNDLNYVWPPGFSRFVLEAMNPNVRQTTAEQDEALSEAIGLELRKIWMHI